MVSFLSQICSPFFSVPSFPICPKSLGLTKMAKNTRTKETKGTVQPPQLLMLLTKAASVYQELRSNFWESLISQLIIIEHLSQGENGLDDWLHSLAKFVIGTIMLLYSYVIYNIYIGSSKLVPVKGAGGPDMINHQNTLYDLFFERGEWDLPVASYFIKKLR